MNNCNPYNKCRESLAFLLPKTRYPSWEGKRALKTKPNTQIWLVMDGDSDSDPKSPLLSKSNGGLSTESGRRARFSRRSSANSLRNDFLSRLPEKVRSGIDVEAPSHIDFSKSKGLSEGVVSLFAYSEWGGKLREGVFQCNVVLLVFFLLSQRIKRPGSFVTGSSPN